MIGLLLGAALVGGVQAATVRSDSTVTVVIQTGLGAITVEVDPARAPITTANFLRYVDGARYDGGTFYRSVRLDNQPHPPKIEVVQGGLGVDEISGGPPFPPIEHEPTSKTGLKHVDGTISMARLALGSAASEFFICIGDQPALDFGGLRHADGQGFAAFGKVTKGMDIVRRIHGLPTDGPTPAAVARLAGQILTKPVRIVSIRRT